MLIVLLVFFGVFFCRDVQGLAMPGPAFGWRLAIYALLQVGGVALLSEWRTARFAWAGVLIQLVEVAVAIALTRSASGRYAWLAWMLPSPAFLLMLYGLSLVLRQTMMNAGPSQALAIATSAWLVMTGGAGWLLSHADSTAEDRKFVCDLALMTSCTALVFIPLGLV
jgi:hypothetical protein